MFRLRYLLFLGVARSCAHGKCWYDSVAPIFHFLVYEAVIHLVQSISWDDYDGGRCFLLLCFCLFLS